MMYQQDELHIELRDNEWLYESVDHDRVVARAIVSDDEGYFTLSELSVTMISAKRP